MALSVDYPSPVWVNGFQCRNCSDVDLAKKHVDPAHPKSGPFNVDAQSDPTRAAQRAVRFGGKLAGLSDVPGTPPTSGSGAVFDLTA